MANNAIYDMKRTAPSSANYFPVWPSHSVNKNILLMYNFIFQQYINKTGFRVCFKELYETKYDSLSIIYTVMSGKYLGCLTMLQNNVLLNIIFHINKVLPCPSPLKYLFNHDFWKFTNILTEENRQQREAANNLAVIY